MIDFLRRTLCLAAALLIFACAARAEGARVTSADSVRSDTQGAHPSAVIDGDDVLVAQSEQLCLYANRESKLFKVLDRRNGYVFSSGRNDAATGALSKKWKAYAASPCAGDFVTLSNLNTFSETPDFDSLELRITDNGLAYRTVFLKAGVTLWLHVTVEGDSLVVTLPDEEISNETGANQILRVSVLPFLGASCVGEGSGYLFMPDGAGALIRFDAPPSNRALTLRAYGRDRSLSAVGERIDQLAALPVKSVEHAALPVMGVAHGGAQNAFVIWAEQGDAYCDIMANPAGNNNLPWYFACMQAVYREIFQQPISATENFAMVQPQANRVDLTLRYTFLCGDAATYVGMAAAYRDYLTARGELSPAAPGAGIPLLLDCLMEESVRALIGTRSQVMTTFDDVLAWSQTLLDAGVSRLILSLEGASRGGVSRSRYDDTRFDPALGDIAVLDALDGRGVEVLVNRPMLKFYGEQLPSGKRGYAITRRFITSNEETYLDDKAYYLRLDALRELAENAAGQLDGIASDDLGRYLYATYQARGIYDRQEAKALVVQALETLSRAGAVALSQPGGYALKYADYAYDIPLSHSSMTFETDAVPFLQMVYAGCVPAFARSQVAGSNTRQTLLRMIDFHLYPHYTLTGREALLLEKSNSNTLFATQAGDLLQGAAEEYALLNSVLGPVCGQRIIDRQVPVDGLSVVTYESGARVAVNYTTEDCIVDGCRVPALCALLIEKEAR